MMRSTVSALAILSCLTACGREIKMNDQAAVVAPHDPDGHAAYMDTPYLINVTVPANQRSRITISYHAQHEVRVMIYNKTADQYLQTASNKDFDQVVDAAPKATVLQISAFSKNCRVAAHECPMLSWTQEDGKVHGENGVSSVVGFNYADGGTEYRDMLVTVTALD